MSVTLLTSVTLAKIDVLELDASISESHTGEVEVTEHPIERGADITDHARPKPDRVTIEGLVSNTPLHRVPVQNGDADTAYTILRDIKDKAKLVKVITAKRVYTNMIMEHLNVPANVKVGDSLQFTAQFKEVVVVQNKTIQTTVAKEPKAQAKVPTGAQAAKVLDDAAASLKRKTILKSFSDNIGLTPALLPSIF